VKEPTVEAFKAGILRALADRPRWVEMGAAARARALEHFNLGGQAALYAKIVEDRLGAADGGRR
jgi:glycosyltransferase involved in cell wall biosynthesis